MPVMRLRTVLQGVLLGSVVVVGQATYAALRSLPSFNGHDPSGSFGDDSLPPLRVLVVGDSSATAPGLDDPDACWPRVVARHLADRHRVDLVCLAEGGARSQDVLEHQVPVAVGSEWDITIVSVGSNDVLHLVPVWRFARCLDSIVERLGERSGAVVLFGVGDLGSIPRLPFPVDRMAWAAGHVADWVHRWVAQRHDTAKVDQWRLTTAAFNSGLHMFAPDLFHPSTAGHRVWADALIPTIDEVAARLGEGALRGVNRHEPAGGGEVG